MVTLVSVALLSMSLGQPLVSIPSPEAVDAAWKRVREAEAPFAGKVLNDRLVVHWLDSSRLWFRSYVCSWSLAMCFSKGMTSCN